MNTDAESLINPHPESLSVLELHELLRLRSENKASFTVIDVREPWENALVAIDGALLIPLGLLASAENRRGLSTEEKIVLHCHHDTRSRQAREILVRSGYTNVLFLEGGIDAWVRAVEPHKKLY